MNSKLKHLMELNHIKSMKVQAATNEELEEAVLELAQAKGRTAIISYLMDYQHKHFAPAKKKKTFEL